MSNFDAMPDGLPESFLNQVIKPGWADIGPAYLTAAKFDHDDSLFSGAVYRATGDICLESIRPSLLGHWRPNDPLALSSSKISGPWEQRGSAIYGGHYFSIWGHFLYETLSTAFDTHRLPDLPVIFTPFAPREDRAAILEEFQRARPMLAAAGWGDREFLLEEGEARFDRLIVPHRLAVYGKPTYQVGMAPEMGEIYSRIRAAHLAEGTDRPVVIAARPSWSQRWHPQEEAVYQSLIGAGCVLVKGWEMSAEEQAKAYSMARAVIGFSGSNLHNTVFAPQGIPVIEIADLRSYGADFRPNMNPVQAWMCRVLKQEVQFTDSYQPIDGQLQALTSEVIVHHVLSLLNTEHTAK